MHRMSIICIAALAYILTMQTAVHAATLTFVAASQSTNAANSSVTQTAVIEVHKPDDGDRHDHHHDKDHNNEHQEFRLEKEHKHHRHPQNVVITTIPSTTIIYAPEVNSVQAMALNAQIYEADPRSYLNRGITPTNVWTNGFFRVTAGYLPANPMTGLIMLEDLHNASVPHKIIYTPQQSGPVRLKKVIFSNAVPTTITVVTQPGEYVYYTADTTLPLTASAAEKIIYTYDMDFGRWVKPDYSD